MTDWVRLWHDMPTDPKWRVIARKSGQPLPCVLAVFTIMLTNASANSEHRGHLLAWDHEDVGAALDIDAEAVEAIYDAMQGKVLDGNALTGWERRQPKREDSGVSARVAKHRATKAAEVKRGVTHCNAPETETETETEILEEEDKSSPSRRVRAQKPQIEVPDWIPKTAWDGWIEMRRLKHAKPSPHAITLAIGELEKLRRDGHDPGAVLDQSTLKNWTGLFPIKEQSNVKRPDNDGLGRTGRAMLAVENQLRQAGHH